MSAPDAHGPTGFWRRWVFSVDHKVIGVQYILAAIGMALVAATLSLLIRLQLAWPGMALFPPEAYLSYVTMHGTLRQALLMPW